MKTWVRVALIAAALLSTTPVLADDISSEVLSAHNALRAKHGVPPLKWSASLAKTAQSYADQCVFEHSSTSNGENLAQGTTGGYSVTDFVNDWYGEISNYDFASGTGDGTGHFTQVVWKATTHVGCGLAHCGDGNDLLVCQYSPAGNIDGQYVDNVPPTK